VRTLPFNAANGGKNFPQTPVNLRLGNWIGGKPGGSQGTIEWAGGLVDLTKGPFDMLVGTVKVTNYNPAGSYKFGDRSGSSASIQINKNGGSTSGVTQNQSSGSNSDSSSSGSGSTSTASARPSSTFTTAIAVVSNAPNGTLPTTRVQTPTVVVPSGTTTPLASSSIVPSNGAGSAFQTKGAVLVSGLIAVMTFFATL